MNKFLIIFLILISCTHPKDKFLEDFGVFVNEVEANYKN